MAMAGAVVVRMVLVWDVCERLGGVADGPGGVVERGVGGGLVGGVADAPAFVEDQWGAEIAGVDDGYDWLARVGSGLGLRVRVEEIVEGRMMMWGGVLRTELRCAANCDGDQSENDLAQCSSAIRLHFTLIQTGASSK
jgi:hypothetical protein